MRQPMTFSVLHKCWLEYNAFRSQFPFMFQIVGERVRKFEPTNAETIDRMANKVNAIMDKYVEPAGDGKWATEDHGGIQRYKLLDEAQREEFEAAHKAWRETVVEVVI